MEVISRSATSALNPNAPLFVPWAYRAVEDFSKEWWDLIQSSAWFRDYWLEERFDEQGEGGEEGEMKEAEDVIDLADEFVVDGEGDAFLPEMGAELDGIKSASGRENGCRDVVSLAGLKWKEGRNGAEKVKKLVVDKAPKFVNVKLSPRLIQQPR